MRHLPYGIAIALSSAAIALAQEPTANDLMAKVGAYAAAYGEKSSVVVGQESYTQQVTVVGAADVIRPIELVAEFAIVKTQGGGWIGFRDVIEVNGQAVRDRKDRLTALLTSTSATLSEAARIANESSRYNTGPISRNFNTPTTALFFFLPEHLARFAFTKKGNKTIDGIRTVEIGYKETKLPTIVTTRSGKNVPLQGSLWVTNDGTVIRSRMHMEKFADMQAPPDQKTPRMPPPTNDRANTGGRAAAEAKSDSATGMEMRPIDSSADIEVTYRKPDGIDLWLPSQMVELYEGVVTTINIRPTSGRTITRATYSNFKQFGSSGKIIPQ